MPALTGVRTASASRVFALGGEVDGGVAGASDGAAVAALSCSSRSWGIDEVDTECKRTVCDIPLLPSRLCAAHARLLSQQPSP